MLFEAVKIISMIVGFCVIAYGFFKLIRLCYHCGASYLTDRGWFRYHKIRAESQQEIADKFNKHRHDRYLVNQELAHSFLSFITNQLSNVNFTNSREYDFHGAIEEYLSSAELKSVLKKYDGSYIQPNSKSPE